MRKKRNIIGLICSIVLVLAMLIGCSEQSASTDSNANADANDTQAAQATPSSAEGTSSEAQQPASQESTIAETASSAEAVVDNENVIDGIDFTTYNNGHVAISSILQEQNITIDKLTAFVTLRRDENGQPINKIAAVLHDGDALVARIDSQFLIEFFGPKKIVDIQSSDSHVFYVGIDSEEEGARGYSVSGVLWPKYDKKGDVDVTCDVKYEDESTDSITIHFTLE